MIFNEKADYYDAIIEMTGLMIVVLDLDGKITHVNSIFENITGYPLSELEGDYWPNKIFSAKDKKSVKTRLQGVFLKNGIT